MTPDEINARPDRVRRYIHDLATRVDPANEVQERWSLREQRDALVRLLGELRLRCYAATVDQALWNEIIANAAGEALDDCGPDDPEKLSQRAASLAAEAICEAIAEDERLAERD